MSDRQTQSYLSAKLGSARLRPKIQFGQNFLIDLNLLDLIVRSAEPTPQDVILEVGTGVGSLTSRMAPLVHRIVTVEIDRDLAKLARETLEIHPNVTLLQTDALKNKNHIREEVLDAITQALQETPNGVFKFVANLPYNVATPLISNILNFQPLPERMVVTLQKELALRLLARPRTKDYSALSVWIQSQCHGEIVRELSNKVFWPRPNVDSAIVRLFPSNEMRQRIHDIDFFHETVRAIFCHRRKFLRSGLHSALKDSLDKSTIDQILASLSLPAEVRAEELDVESMIALVEACRQAIAG